jgi:mono/diheme cytochrome c family protein
MKFLVLICAMALSSAAQDVAKQGEQIFAKTCATAYCHGPKGASSGAQRLAGRDFNQAYINGVVTRGIPGTGMRSFAAVLSKADLTAVVAYVATLNGISNTGPGAGDLSAIASSGPALTGEAARGVRLFTEAVRGFGRCSTCHEVGGVGISVAGPIANVPASVAALKALATPNVKTGVLDGESMPVLVLSDGKQSALFYDLTSVPPVERSALPGSVKFAAGSTWRHSSVIAAYNDAELDAILAYIRAVN